MAIWAQIVSGIARDVCGGDDKGPHVAPGYNPNNTAWVRVPDGTQSGAVDSGNGTFINPAPHAPTPNTPNNPYFGKRPLATKDFYALIGQILAPDRLKRLLSDSHFLWVGKVLDHVDIVDTDDKAGQFVKILAYLIATNGDDAAPLLEKGERDAIMTAWK